MKLLFRILVELKWFAIGIAFYFVFNFFIGFAYVPTASMEPTISTESFILYWKHPMTYDNGNIVVFEKEETLLVKRLIGKDEQTIKLFDNGFVEVEGDILQEEYLKDQPTPFQNNTKSRNIEVPEDHYFMLGDNRNNSFDSSKWKNPFISEKDLKGVVFFKY